MSLPPQHKDNTDKSGKQRAAMKEAVQHSGEVYYGVGPPALESNHTDSGSGSVVYNQEKGPQSRVHYQQAAPVKWMYQDTGWSQEAPVPPWGQNFGPYGGGVRGQMVFHKGAHDVGGVQMGGDGQSSGSVEVYREATQAPMQAQARGLEWEQRSAAALHQPQLQVYQQGHKGVDIQGQPHAPSHTVPSSVLQPFQTTFRPAKQQFPPGYYPVFQGNKGMPGLGYSEQPKSQHQLLHQMQQQHQLHQQQQQQQLQQHQLQQQQQQHLQQQQHQQQHQMQQHQIQQQQLQQIQQQYHQQQLQERRNQMRQLQQLQSQGVAQQDITQMQVLQKPQVSNLSYPHTEHCPSDASPQKENVQSVSADKQRREAEIQSSDSSATLELSPEKGLSSPTDSVDAPTFTPRRSRRLSKDGLSPVIAPSTNPWSQQAFSSKNGHDAVGEVGAGAEAVRAEEAQVTTGGVIQSTRRRRRASKEINLETLALQASEMKSLPAKVIKQEGGPHGRQAGMMPLVFPVSVPVCGSQMEPAGAWPGMPGQSEHLAAQPDHKPSVIVARRRSLRNSLSESIVQQEGENCPGQDKEEGKSKSKRRPRPEPLFIPPPKPSTFIAPSVYSSITPYQSHLRSPLRLPDHHLTLPPYTPPPILSPVREGSGLYFSTFLSSIAAGTQSLPPPITPKSAARSLLRSTSSDITSPPVLPIITDATPVSFEPRINIGPQYQAEVPELMERSASQSDCHKADLVWVPMPDSNNQHLEHMENIMNLACSSVFCGGGTNQELVLHCLHQCGGDVLETLRLLMLEPPVFPKGHHLADYHYSGSDTWTAAEKRYFNKGITAYRKDFFMVQKLIQSKSVCQCVEFYYTHKKQMKIGRNGALTFGPADSPPDKSTEAVVDIKSSQQPKLPPAEPEGSIKMEPESYSLTQDGNLARVTQSLQAHDYAGVVVVLRELDGAHLEARPQPAAPPTPRRPPPETGGRKSRAPPKPRQDPEGVFPCKKCGRVFTKVKSRSAHMKSHADQAKKAVALRQREEEEERAAAQARKTAAAAAAAAATAAAAAVGNEGTEQAENSSREESSETTEDEDDEDWR